MKAGWGVIRTPYAFYLRKSRADVEAEARGEGETLARHEKILTDLSKRLKLNVTQVYKEVVSGETIAARPVMQQLLSEVSQCKWDGVLVVEVERLARGDTIDQGIVAQTFKFSNTKIITPMKTYDPSNEFDEEYFEFGLFMSRREYKTINRRLQRGRISSLKEGKFVGNKTPYGYRRVKIENDKGWTLEIQPEEANVIRLIFDLYTKGEVLPDGDTRRLGTALIARRLNQLKVPTKTGSLWTTATVSLMLRNPVYCGKLRWNYRANVKKMVDGKVQSSRPRAAAGNYLVVDGLHPPIISNEEFAQAQKYLALNPPKPVGENKTIKNPLAGLVTCGKCGRKMIRRPAGPRQARDVLMCSSPECDNVSSYLDDVEAAILNCLRDWLTGYKIEFDKLDRPVTSSLSAMREQTAQRLTDELKDLDKQLDNIHDLVEKGIYTTDKFLERSRLIAEKIKQTKEDLEAVNAEIALDAAREKSRKEIVPQVETLLDIYHLAPDAKHKNDLLKSILGDVAYIKEKRSVRGGPPAPAQIILHPKVPPPSYWGADTAWINSKGRRE